MKKEFKIGDRVFDLRHGWGVVWSINDTVNVEFTGENLYNYTYDGRDWKESPIMLYHHDYTPTESLKQTFDSGNNESELQYSYLLAKFSGMAMQGYLSANCEFGEDDLARYSIKCADALIRALNESKTS